MMKLLHVTLFIFSLWSAQAEQSCVSQNDYNQSRVLQRQGDAVYISGSFSASERLCAQQRRAYFTHCMNRELESVMDSQLKLCPDSSSAGNTFLQEARARCGSKTYEHSHPDCPAEEYSFPSCQQFSGYVEEGVRNRCVLDDISPGIGTLEPLAENMTRLERHQQVLFRLRDNLVSNFERGLEPLTVFRTCLQAQARGNSDHKVTISGQEVECSKITDVLMAKVIMNLPALRQNQILSQGPHLRTRSQSDRNFRRAFRRNYRDSGLSDEEIQEIGQNVSLRRQELPIGESPQPTLEEIRVAAEIRKEQFSFRDQQFLESYQDKEPFKDCVIAEGEGEERILRFISLNDDRRRAMLCGINSATDELKITNTIFTRADELNMDDANSMMAHDAFLSYRAKVSKQHEEAVNLMIEENPFLAHLNLSTDDLPSENDSEEVQATKRNNVYAALLRSFALMEGQARDELNKLKNETSLGNLRSTLMRNPMLVEESIKNQPNLDKRTCDTLQSLQEGQEVSERLSSTLRITASILGGLTCPFTWGAGCLLAAGVQIPHVNELNKRKNLALGEFFTGQGSLENYLAAEREHWNSRALLGLEFVGIPVLGTGKLVLRSAREASRIARFSPAGLRATEPIVENIPRMTFGRDVARGASVSRSQGNVEVFTVHGMGSSHSAIRIGDTVYHTGQGFGKSIGSSIPGAKGDFVAEPFEAFLARETRGRRAVEGLTLRVPESELAILRSNAESMAEAGQRYSLMRNNCAQTVCDIVTQNGTRTIDVERTFDPLVLRERFNTSLGDRAVAQNVYGAENALGSSTRRRYLMANAVYAVGLSYGEAFFDVLPE